MSGLDEILTLIEQQQKETESSILKAAESSSRLPYRAIPPNLPYFMVTQKNAYCKNRVNNP